MRKVKKILKISDEGLISVKSQKRIVKQTILPGLMMVSSSENDTPCELLLRFREIRLLESSMGRVASRRLCAVLNSVRSYVGKVIFFKNINVREKKNVLKILWPLAQGSYPSVRSQKFFFNIFPESIS